MYKLGENDSSDFNNKNINVIKWFLIDRVVGVQMPREGKVLVAKWRSKLLYLMSSGLWNNGENMKLQERAALVSLYLGKCFSLGLPS